MEENNKQHELHKFIVDKGQKSLRIDKFLVDRIENTSRSKIQSAAEGGHLLVNGEAVKSNYKVKPGDVIQIMTFYKPEKVELIAENIPLNIIFEDDQILILNKPSDMVVHPAYGNHTGTLVNALMFHLQGLIFFNSGELRAGLVHRLDKNTTGVMVIAKDDETLTNLSKQFFDRETKKKYLALVWGIPKEKEGTIKGHIGRSLQNRKIMRVYPDGEIGKHAVTHYRVLQEFGYVSLLECILETGRTHQIRVHLKYLGHPIFGDIEYGGTEILRGTKYTKYKQFIHNCFQIMPAQALHAQSLEITHPKTNETLVFNAEVPENFKILIDKWRDYIQYREIETL